MRDAEPVRALKPGDDIAGKYTVESILGAGGMGVVYRALHRRLSQHVAIKMLLPSMLSHPVIVARFEREARAAGQLRSRHTARVIDVGEVDDVGPYMVMEFLQGQDLGAELDQRGPLPVAEAVEWVVQACAAMAEAHDRGIIHRDLKPANLFLAEEEEGRVLKVLDFGISKVEDASSSSVTSTHATMGTPLYMSPEQVRSSKMVDPRTDIWSLGVILYELLSGKTPFEGAPAAVGAAIVSEEVPSVELLRKDVPAELAAAVKRALAKNREERFPDARTFAAAIAPFARRAGAHPSQRVPASDPRLQADAADAGLAVTLAAEEVAPRAVHGVSVPVVNRATTDAGWAASNATLRKRRTGLLVLAGVALAGSVAAGSVVAFVTRAPSGGASGASTTSAAITSASAVAFIAKSAEPATSVSGQPSATASMGVAMIPASAVSSARASIAPPVAPAPRPSMDTSKKPPVVPRPPAGENPNRL